MIDRMIIMNYQRAVEVFGDEYYIEFKIQDKTNINPAKSYELIVLISTKTPQDQWHEQRCRDQLLRESKYT